MYSVIVILAFQKAQFEFGLLFPAHHFSIQAFLWGLIGNGCWSFLSLIWSLEAAATGTKAIKGKWTYALFFIRPLAAGYSAVIINEVASSLAPGISDILLKSFAILGGFTFVFWAKPAILKRVYTKYVEKKVLDDEK
jgi:hypothetical protein